MTIDFKHENNRFIVAIQGRLDTETAPKAEESVSAEYADEKEIVFDITQLEYISSAGLRFLLKWQKKANAEDKEMLVKGADDNVKEILDVTGFSDILTLT